MEKRLLDIEIEHLTAMAYRYGRLIEAKNAEGPAKLRQYSKQAESARAEEVNIYSTQYFGSVEELKRYLRG